jgi:hypothetical protein
MSRRHARTSTCVFRVRLAGFCAPGYGPIIRREVELLADHSLAGHFFEGHVQALLDEPEAQLEPWSQATGAETGRYLSLLWASGWWR